MITLRLPPDPASATRARRVTREHLATICPTDTIETAGLLVTELVANAVLHAHTDMLLVVDVEPGRVDLRVQDGSPAQPEQQEPDLDAVNGRGLAIVDELSTSWGVENVQGSKVVWCELEFTPATSPTRSQARAEVPVSES